MSEVFQRRLKPDAISYNALIGGLCRKGMSMQAREVLCDMLERGVEPSILTYKVILAGFCKEHNMEEAKNFFGGDDEKWV